VLVSPSRCVLLTNLQHFICCGFAEEDELSDVSLLDTSIQTDNPSVGETSAENVSPSPHRQPHGSRQQADRDTRRCRSLSRSRERQGYSPTHAADNMGMIDGVQLLATADATSAEHSVGGMFGHSSLSLSVDSVSGSHKRKAVAMLPGNEQKSHRKSL